MNSRTYDMAARAASASATADRILDAATARFARLPYERIRLEDVADDASVTPQTVLRKFGSKAGLIVAVAERGLGMIAQARASAPSGDPVATVRDLVAHYARWGSLILKMYAEADRIEGMPELASRGRRFHVEWCRQAFEPHLTRGLDEPTRNRRLAQIVTVCDAATWRILHDEFDLDDAEIERALVEMMAPLIASN